jgi:hypothetical protein
MPTAGRPKITVRLDEHELRQFQAIAYNAGQTAADLARQLILARIREETPEALPDWRDTHMLIRDDNGEKLNARDFGLVAGERIKSSYVLAHPEMPWPQWIVQRAQKASERTET